jgi:hypothetical protein
MVRGMVAAAALIAAAPASAAVTLTFEEGTYTFVQDDGLVKTYESNGVRFFTSGSIANGVLTAAKFDQPGVGPTSAFELLQPYFVAGFDLSNALDVAVLRTGQTLAANVDFHAVGSLGYQDVLIMVSDGPFQIDNLVLGDPSAVPEPATWAMMIAGFGLVGATARRRIRPALAGALQPRRP